MKTGEDNVDSEGSINRNLEFEMIISCFLLRLCEMVFHRLEHALYVLVLVLIELLYLPSLVCIVIELDRAAAIALSGCVGCDLLYLVFVLVGRR